MNIKDVAILWLAGCGFDEQQTNSILLDPKMQLGIRINDNLTIWESMRNAVHKLGLSIDDPAYMQYNKDYNNSREKLMFLCAK